MPDYIRDALAPPLEGQEYVRFVIGADAEGLFLRITERVSEGSVTPGTTGPRDHTIHLHTLLDRIATVMHDRQDDHPDGPYFKNDDWEGISNNVRGFVTAVLINIGFVEAVPKDGGGHHRGKYRFRQCLRKSPPFAGMAPATRQGVPERGGDVAG